ncbi:GntR family trehalose operon transcriptional repressor [Weissella uvarum]|uniref:trehalose operon repressor n=1 Tax=Weissella uvarum TaxID=1479233 RepID=UPI001EF76DF1|nr:trehalose operon repressor [Weissella uvarum]MBM7616552.1 GntR family trehalose operon transcriptional repressor [Weissella uvarum]
MEKYREIYSDLKQRLDAGEFEAGKLLPSDHKLMRDYHVARETVRKAMKLLAEEGYVQRLRGKGTIAIDQKQFHFPLSEITSYSELVQLEDLNSTNRLIDFETMELPAYFGADEKIPVYKIVRLRLVDGECDIIDYDYVSQAVAPDITPKAAQQSLFLYFEKQLGLEIDYAVKTLTVEAANADDRRYMNIPSHTPMVVVRSKTYLKDSRVLSYTESRHRADRFSTVVFAKRH